MSFIVIIPARFGSTRLPGKPLLEIGGKPLIQWVYECALASDAQRVIVATDNERISASVEMFGGEVCMTRDDHASGSDRIAEVVHSLQIPHDQIVVNLQGDEPEMPAALVTQVVDTLVNDENAVIATACHRLNSKNEFQNPNVVKVVRDQTGAALYFSRAPIPWPRAIGGTIDAFRHIGIYAYRAGYLTLFSQRPCSNLERAEQLEQLRVLESGGKIAVCEAVELPGPGIDTLDDLEEFRTKCKSNLIKVEA